MLLSAASINLGTETEKVKPDTLSEARFVSDFQSQLDGYGGPDLEMATVFRELEQWSSMQALIVIASFEWNYGKTITAEEFLDATTIRDLFNAVKGKLEE